MPESNQVDQSRSQSQPPQSPVAAPIKPLHKSREMSARGRVISLIIGDALCFIIFAVLGPEEHGEGFNLLYDLWVALPFLLGWFIASPFIGAFRAEVASKPAAMIRRTLLAWLCAWPVAMLLRWLLVDLTKHTPWSDFLAFSCVALIVNAGLLLFWRWPFARNNSLRKRGV